ncbi:carbohydrate sulfotransferase [Elysia marginata]|uniref:Carbohydrate sulfotransferase n=1 Tax=Elysia marginata TaxID=1093978 RepID=A0AAV4ECX5_9GAST|nr:carbohydrate sulfotransferase [Elysia marginata]
MNIARVLKGLFLLSICILTIVLYFKGPRLHLPSLILGHHRLTSLIFRDAPFKSRGLMRMRKESRHTSPHKKAKRKAMFTAEVLKQAEKDVQARRDQVHRACSRLGHGSGPSSGPGMILPRALVSVNKATVYCPVEKTASTFFRRFVYQLEHTEPMRSPFEVPVKMIYACHTLFTKVDELAEDMQTKRDTHQKRIDRLKKRRPKLARRLAEELAQTETIDSFLKRATNFLFVRDPFSRLFSAYVDKLLAPNPEFWDSWGLFALQKHRADPEEKSQRCGHDVTFAEFLKFVLDLDLTHPDADPHLRPIFELCRPCDVDYSVIGFMGTFQRDVVFLSNMLNVTESQIEFYKMADDTVNDALQDSMMGAFTEWAHRLSTCVTKGEIIRRIWRKLQLRGFISARINFSPKMLKESVEYLEADDFLKVLAKAVESSTDKDELYKQKMAAMVSAYKTVDLDTLNKIVHLYAADFRAFGFNERPRFIFDREEKQEALNYSKALDFRVEWSL